MKIPDINQVMIAAVSTAAFIFLVRKSKALTVSGTVSAVVLGLTVLLCTGFAGIWPLVVFLGGSIVLSRLETEHRVRIDEKSGRPRDMIQVLSNGGIYGLGAIFYALTNDYHFLICMSVSISISTCDTWSSEAGTRLSGQAFDPFRFRRVSAGVSGGMSIAGTLTGITGAGLMAILTSFLFALLSKHALIFAGGITGMLLDSLFGSLLQKKYLDKDTGEWIDASANYSDERGLSFVTNDMVNILSNLIATVFFYFVA